MLDKNKEDREAEGDIGKDTENTLPEMGQEENEDNQRTIVVQRSNH